MYGTYEDRYRGCQNTTDKGAPCKKWADTASGESVGAHNYCRYPGKPPEVAFGKTKPEPGKFRFWCYTDDPDKRNPAWGYCRPAGPYVTGWDLHMCCLKLLIVFSSVLRVCHCMINSLSLAYAECSKCDPGRYNGKTGSKTYDDCIKCDAGRYNPDIAAVDVTQCKWCSGGRVQSEKNVRNVALI